MQGSISGTTTGGSEEENVDTDEGDLGIDCMDVSSDCLVLHSVDMVEPDGVTNNGDYELAGEHSERTTAVNLRCCRACPLTSWGVLLG